MLTASLVVIAFSQMFFIAGTAVCDYSEGSNQEWQCSARSSLFQSFGMFLSTEYDFMTWENDSNKSMLETIAFMFAVVVGILLLNILIAVVNNEFTKVSEASENAFWTTRLDIMVEVNEIRNFVLSFCSSNNNNNVSEEKKENSSIKKKVKTSRKRKEFARYDDNWMRSKCSDEDLEAFFKVSQNFVFLKYLLIRVIRPDTYRLILFHYCSGGTIHGKENVLLYERGCGTSTTMLQCLKSFTQVKFFRASFLVRSIMKK